MFIIPMYLRNTYNYFISYKKYIELVSNKNKKNELDLNETEMNSFVSKNESVENDVNKYTCIICLENLE